MTNWLARTELLLGSETIKKLNGSDVLVVGVGGVGSYAAELICRAGVGSMTIVDGDTVHVTNRNRQLPALKMNEGISKCEIMGERMLQINPELKLTVLNEYLRDERMIEVLEKGYDYVVDAIDTLSPKIFLIHHTVRLGMKLVSSMGAGGKFDPLQIRVDDISETNCCNLARTLRKRLHRLGIISGFKAVYSPELVDKSRIVRVEGEMNKASIVGTISYMPAAFGIVCASVVIRDLAGIQSDL